MSGDGGAERPVGMARADFVTGLVLMALGLAVVVESLRMPRFEALQINPYTVPGLVPGVLGLVILILGGALAARAARAGGWRLGSGSAWWRADGGVRRLVLSLALCLGYAALLVGRLPFWLATWLFISAFIALFEWPLAGSRRERMLRLAFALAFGLVVAVIVAYVFERVFLVRLP
jgi:hypothetical protein